MKSIFLSVFVLVFFIFGQDLPGQNKSDAVIYMEELTKSYNQLKIETWHYMKSITRGKGVRKVENKRQDLLKEIKSVKTEVQKQKAFGTDASLKNAIVEFLDLEYTVLNEDFGKILDMEDIAEQSYDLMEAYLLAKEKANEKLDVASDELQVVQKAFAAANNITLIEDNDKLSQKIDKAGEALKYYNQIYLIFFKCYKQEMYLMEALQKADVGALEQNKNTLVTFSDESLLKLNDAGNFKNDASLNLAAKQMLTFYKSEADEYFPKAIDYFIKKDNFEKLKKIFDSKSSSNRTQQDVDQYNKAVNDYNDAVNIYNASNNSANEKRSKYLEQWNQKIEAFFDNHAN